MNRRIKLVLLDSKLTQVEFAKRIGISRTGLQKLISGENNPREQTIRAICSEFNVRRAWLETGEGEMRNVPNSNDEIVDEVLAGDDEYVKAVIRGIAKIPGGWEKMRDFFTCIYQELQKIPPKD